MFQNVKACENRQHQTAVSHVSGGHEDALVRQRTSMSTEGHCFIKKGFLLSRCLKQLEYDKFRILVRNGQHDL